MKYKFPSLIFCSLFLSVLPHPTEAAFTLKDGRVINVEYAPTMSVEGHFNAGVEALRNGDWPEAFRQFTVVFYNFPDSSYAQEAYFYAGASAYNCGELDIANQAFSDYLQGRDQPRFFQETLEYKFAIAEQFRQGARKRLLGSKKLPKWGSGETIGLSIYDEIIASVPCHSLAAQSLYSKGMLHWSRKEFRDCIDCFNMIAKRFPKHELAPECYVLINKVYLDQCRLEFQNPDILAFAQINLLRFKQQFPREERIVEAEQDVLAVKEIYARGLYNTGQFYGRIGKPQASIIYYQNAVRQFPETYVAQLSIARLQALGSPVPTIHPNPMDCDVDKDEESDDSEIPQKIQWMASP